MPGKKLPQKKLDKIKELHNKGCNNREIGNVVGLNSRTISYHLKNLNLKPNFFEEVYTDEKSRIKGYMIRNIKASAKRRGIPFDLSWSDLDLPTHCPVLGLKLSYNGEPGFNSNHRATVDRIDNTIGYIPGNVWIISRLANTMKNEADLLTLELFCNNILDCIKSHRARGDITDSKSLDP